MGGDSKFDDMTEPELRELFVRVLDRIKAMLPDGTGFVLLAAPFGAKNGVAQYASNVRREDAARWMLETVDRWGAGDYVPRE